MSNLFQRNSLYLIFRCGFTNVISACFFSLYIIIDGIFVGQFLGSQDLAAMGLIMPFISIAFAFVEIIAIGSSVLIAFKLGQNKHKEANILFTSSLVLIFCISLIIGILMLVLSPLTIFFNTTSPIQQNAKNFIQIYALFMPIIMFSFVLDNYLRVCGRNFFSMFLNIFIALGNIILDYLFIVVFKQGLYSAALATCIVLSLASVLGFIPFVFKSTSLNFSKFFFKIKIFIPIFINGSSDFLSNISGSILGIFANILLLEIGGEQAVATFSILIYIDSFIVVILMSLCEGLQAPLSYNYITKARIQLKNLIAYTFTFSAVISLSAFFLCIHLGEKLVQAFSQEAKLIELTSHALSLFALNYCITWFNICVNSFLTAFKKAKSSLLLALMQNLLLPLLFLFILPKFWGLNGIYLTSFFADLLSLILAYILLKKAFLRI